MYVLTIHWLEEVLEVNGDMGLNICNRTSYPRSYAQAVCEKRAFLASYEEHGIDMSHISFTLVKGEEVKWQCPVCKDSECSDCEAEFNL